MQRAVEIRFEGQESSFKVTKIDRSKLYGLRRRIPVDAQGGKCSFASLTRDGRFILPKGGMALLYLDEQGEVVEPERLQAVAPDGSVIPKHNGADEVMEIGEPIRGGSMTLMDLLDYVVTQPYSLEPVFLTSNLEAALSQGAIYHVPGFNDNGNGSRQAFLLCSDAGYFMLLGEWTGFDFLGLSEADLSPPDEDDDFCEESSADLDFTMW